MKKHNEGFTIVELLCAIVAGSIVTAATATILLLGLRMNANVNKMATEDNQAVICLTVMENMVKEHKVIMVDGEFTEIKVVDESENETALFTYSDRKIKTSSGAVLLEDVDKCVFEMKSGLLTIKFSLDENISLNETPFVKTILPRTGQIINIGS